MINLIPETILLAIILISFFYLYIIDCKYPNIISKRSIILSTITACICYLYIYLNYIGYSHLPCEHCKFAYILNKDDNSSNWIWIGCENCKYSHIPPSEDEIIKYCKKFKINTEG